MAKKVKRDYWEITKNVFKIISAGFSILMFIIFGIFFISLLSLLVGEGEFQTGNVAVIPIHGAITVGNGDMWSSQMVQSSQIMKFLDKAEEDDMIKAVVLDIDSPGGAPVASDEIAKAVKMMKKPVVGVIREVGASGAFWIATAADKLYANRMSITGSIGVIGSQLEFAGLMKDYNVTYRRLVAGKYKDAGTPFKEMSKEEQEKFQKLLDDLHKEFIKGVAYNRNMEFEDVEKHADGFIFLGGQAKEYGFVDELGGITDAVKYLENELNITAETVEYKKTPGIGDLLGTMSTEGFYSIGKGIGESFKQDRVSFSYT